MWYVVFLGQLSFNKIIFRIVNHLNGAIVRVLTNSVVSLDRWFHHGWIKPKYIYIIDICLSVLSQKLNIKKLGQRLQLSRSQYES